MNLYPISSSSAFHAIAAQQKANGTPASSASASNSNNSSAVGLSDAQSLGSTFLNLLATELKTQDPTSPMDPTAMVGQMISLNQLDQLISMNQILSGLKPSTPTTGAAVQNVAQQQAYNALGGK